MVVILGGVEHANREGVDPTRRKGLGATTESGHRGKAPDLDGPLGKQHEDPTTTDTQGGPAMPGTPIDPPKRTILKPSPAVRTWPRHRGDHRQPSHHREAAAAFSSRPSIHLPGPTQTAAHILGGTPPEGKLSPGRACASMPVACEFGMGVHGELLEAWERACQGMGKASASLPSAHSGRKAMHVYVIQWSPQRTPALAWWTLP